MKTSLFLLAATSLAVAVGAGLFRNATPKAEAPQAATSKAKLRWAPPALENPITVAIGQGYTSKNLKSDRDYIIKLPAEKQVGGIALKGGRNVVLIGGSITVPPGAANQGQQRAIYITGATGTVHIEGVNIDNSGGSEFDGIAASAPDAILQLQNVRITGLSGSQKTLHADVFQPWGGLREIRIDHLTGTSDYQGLQIPPDRAPIGRAELRNINLGHLKPAQGRPGFLLWLTKGTSTCKTYPMTLENVYVEARAGESVGRSVWPPVGTGNSACAAVEDDGQVSWPKLPEIQGAVHAGPPSSGDFVPEGVAGVNYVAAGYAIQ